MLLVDTNKLNKTDGAFFGFIAGKNTEKPHKYWVFSY